MCVVKCLLGRRYLRERRGFLCIIMRGIEWMNANNSARRKSMKPIIHRKISLRFPGKIIRVFSVCYDDCIIVLTN